MWLKARNLSQNFSVDHHMIIWPSYLGGYQKAHEPSKLDQNAQIFVCFFSQLLAENEDQLVDRVLEEMWR